MDLRSTTWHGLMTAYRGENNTQMKTVANFCSIRDNGACLSLSGTADCISFLRGENISFDQPVAESLLTSPPPSWVQPFVQHAWDKSCA